MKTQLLNCNETQLQRYQDQIYDLIKNRHLPRTNDSGKENIVMIIERNSIPEEDEFFEYPYYIERIHSWFITKKRQRFSAQYPHHSFMVEELDKANRFKVQSHIEHFQCQFRLFDLAQDAFHKFRHNYNARLIIKVPLS